ncbi:MAG: DUF1565 domain-containing protein, partial [Actinomycetota bacterium]|nr:DUF1565 domain-containing protein [Actinomycetota bacterium]
MLAGGGDPDPDPGATDFIYVSLAGSDANSGSSDSPKRTVEAGIAAASAAVKDVKVAAGTYDEGDGAELSDGVDVTGGFDPATWAAGGGSTVIQGSPQALLANDDDNITLTRLTLQAASTAAPGSCAYGIRAADSTGLELVDMVITSGAG